MTLPTTSTRSLAVFGVRPCRPTSHTGARPGPALSPPSAALVVRWRGSIRPWPLSTVRTLSGRSPAGGRGKTSALAALSCGWLSWTSRPSAPPASTIVCAPWRWVSRASIVTRRPSRTLWPQTVSTSVSALGLADPAWCGSVSPARGAKPEPRGVSGAPCCLEPRRVWPATARAIAGASGAAGAVAPLLAAQALTWASHASRSRPRKLVCSVAAQGVWGVPPRARALAVPSWRPPAALALALREPHNLAQHARASRAAQGWRLPRA